MGDILYGWVPWLVRKIIMQWDWLQKAILSQRFSAFLKPYGWYINELHPEKYSCNDIGYKKLSFSKDLVPSSTCVHTSFWLWAIINLSHSYLLQCSYHFHTPKSYQNCMKNHWLSKHWLSSCYKMFWYLFNLKVDTSTSKSLML